MDGDLMIKSKKLLIKFTIIIQTLMLLFMAVMVPAAADDSQGALPKFPINVDGELYVNGEKAPVGTLISVKVNGVDVGSTVVTTEGVYGDGFGNKLPISSELEDYSNVDFYINGVKVKVNPFIDSNKLEDGFLTLEIKAEVSKENEKPKVSGGMGGIFEEATEKPKNGNINQEETTISDIGAEAPPVIEGPATSSVQGKSIPVEEGFNTMLIAVCGIGLLLVAGILVYKSKKNQKE